MRSTRRNISRLSTACNAAPGGRRAPGRPGAPGRCSGGGGRSRTFAFTLIELLVTIGVILLLMGITVQVGVNVVRKGEERTTEAAIQLLDQAMKEWELQAERKITLEAEPLISSGVCTFEPDVYYMTNRDYPVFLISEALRPVMRVSASRSIIEKINPDQVHQYKEVTNGVYPEWIDLTLYTAAAYDAHDDDVTVLDAWNKPIQVIHPGPLKECVSVPSDELDEDGTARTTYENQYGVGVNNQICFVSAGLDGEFGSFQLDIPEATRNEVLLKQAEDNIYSYPPLKLDAPP